MLEITGKFGLGGTSLLVQLVKNPPAMQETLVQFLGWEDPLEKEIAIHSSILAREIPRKEERGGLHTVHGVAKNQTRLSTHALLTYCLLTEQGAGQPLDEGRWTVK